MDGDPRQETSKQASATLEVPICVQVYVWVFMVTFSVSPLLCVLCVHGGVQPGNGLQSLVMIGLIQIMLYLAQRRCSSRHLSYWEGLLAVACSVTTGENLMSLFRACCLLLAVVIVSIMFAVDHDGRYSKRHAAIRYGKLIVWLHKQRLWGPNDV